MTKFEPIDARTLSITPLPPVRWLIPDLLSGGLSMLSGGSKIGKSWLCLWLCLQLAKGGELWGRPLRAQAVLYLCLEDTYARIQNRLFHLSEEEMPDNLYFQTACEGLGHGLEEQIEQFLAVRPDTGLVVIDTLQKVRTGDANGNVYACDYRDMSALKSLADRHNIGILLVHHQRKDRTGDPFDDISGSVALMGGADTIWLLQRQRMSNTARLLLKQGVPMKQIQEWLGHSDISTTANIYAHLDSQSKQLSAATMEKALALPEELPESRW